MAKHCNAPKIGRRHARVSKHNAMLRQGSQASRRSFQSSLRGSTILGIPATIPLSFLFHFPPRVFFIVD
uniref:Uncharacterized protein n=1 Tax=Cucumis sativus TaxID=3659 RepID=A0A0A0LJZ0_CUCSA